MKSISMFAVLMCAATLTTRAQDAAATLPKNYRVQFENEWVKVTSVRYGPNESLPGHSHTPTLSAYVYLNDGPPVVFRHVGGSAATRPATRAGALRVYRGLDEVHEVQNTVNVASEFLRIEFKTEPREVATFRGKFERPPSPAADASVHLDHPQVRISRLWILPGQRLKIQAGSEPALLVALASSGGHQAGKELWIGAGAATELSNGGTTPIDFLRFDLKTQPLPATR